MAVYFAERPRNGFRDPALSGDGVKGKGAPQGRHTGELVCRNDRDNIKAVRPSVCISTNTTAW